MVIIGEQHVAKLKFEICLASSCRLHTTDMGEVGFFFEFEAAFRENRDLSMKKKKIFVAN